MFLRWKIPVMWNVQNRQEVLSRSSCRYNWQVSPIQGSFPPFSVFSSWLLSHFVCINILENNPGSLNAFHYGMIHRFQIVRMWRGRIIWKETFLLLWLLLFCFAYCNFHMQTCPTPENNSYFPFQFNYVRSWIAIVPEAGVFKLWLVLGNVAPGVIGHCRASSCMRCPLQLYSTAPF